jgi:nitrate reductase gamma subunit
MKMTEERSYEAILVAGFLGIVLLATCFVLLVNRAIERERQEVRTGTSR